MPAANIIDDLIGNLAPHFRRNMALVRRLRREAQAAGRIDLHADAWLRAMGDIATPLRVATVLYMGVVEDLHLKIALHKSFSVINSDAQKMGQEVFAVLAHLCGGDDAVDGVVRRILSLQAHHFIPATGWSRFRPLRSIFPNPGEMPAVNLLTFEHQGPIHLIQQLAEDAPGIVGGRRKAMLTANMTRSLNLIAEEVEALPGLTDKQRSLTYLDRIVTFYDGSFADVGNGVRLLDQATDFPAPVLPRTTGQWSGWTARQWIRETRQAVSALPGP
ncbi:MAG: hypothetical protein ACTHOH_10485 [Lysobacteraceae bacterium]